MDFADTLKSLSDRLAKLKDNIQTEEATKNALIMPFIQALGYDVFNPLEVVPEFISDVGIKKGEKIDYAIMKDGQPAVLIECKHWNENLDVHDGQLIRYFNVSKARFGVLTNGVRYKFFTDLVEPNKMDEKPFLQFDLTDLKDAHVEELKKFHKSYYDPETIFSNASDLKYMNELRALFVRQLREPDEKFVRFMAGEVYQGRVTSNVVTTFTDLVKRSFNQLMSDMVTERLKTALKKEAAEAKEQEDEQAAKRAADAASKERTVETTEEELEAYFIIKSILHQAGYGNRVGYKDNMSYCNIVLDDSVRKTIARLFFNGEKKYVLIYDSDAATRVDVDAMDVLYKYSEQLKRAVEVKLAPRKAGAADPASANGED